LEDEPDWQKQGEEHTGIQVPGDFLQDIIAYKTEHIQESPLTIIHFQHDKRYSLALEKSNFLQQMLQQQPPTIPAVSLSSRVSFYLPLAAEIVVENG
jgi:chromosome segregation and condensation protein ScpB